GPGKCKGSEVFGARPRPALGEDQHKKEKRPSGHDPEGRFSLFFSTLTKRRTRTHSTILLLVLRLVLGLDGLLVLRLDRLLVLRLGVLLGDRLLLVLGLVLLLVLLRRRAQLDGRFALVVLPQPRRGRRVARQPVAQVRRLALPALLDAL